MKKIIYSTLFIFVSLVSFSQKQALDTVEVTATSAQNKSILHQPVSITKLGVTELKRGTGLTLDDVINTSVPGVTMQRRTIGAGQQFNIRGYGNGTRGTRGVNSNFDGQGYKVYLNDIPVTDAEGITLMDDIDFGSIGNVEIVKGAAGTLYGLAIAGAVNLKTVKATKGQTTIGQDVLFGNYGLQRYTTHVALGSEKSSVLINYGSQKSDGYMLHTASDKKFGNFVGNFTPNTKQTINTYFGYSNSYDERGGELTLAQYNADDYSGNIDYIKRNAHSNVISVRLGVGHTYQFNSNISNTTTVFGTGLNSNVSSAGGWTDKGALNAGVRSSFATKFSLGKKATLTGLTGVETQYQRANTIGYSMKQNPFDTTTNGWSIGKPYWVVNAATSNVYTVTSTTSFFHEWTLELPKDSSFTAGIGISRMRILLDDRFNAATATKPSLYDTTYKSMVSPHLAINKVVNKNMSVYASWSTGYKAPVSSYFFITTPIVGSANPATGRVNETLKPEYAEQVEIGTKGSLLNSKLNFQLAWYSAIIKDKMTTVAVPLNNTTTAYSYVTNGGSQQQNGIEALIKYDAIKRTKGCFSSFVPFISFTYSDHKYKNFIYKTGSTTSNISSIDYSGLNVFGTPKINVGLGFDAALKCGVYFNATHLYRDGVNIGFENVAGTNVLRQSTSYNIVNGKIGYRKSIGKHFDIDAYFGADNITGVKYPLMIFANQLPDAYLPAAPKALTYGGASLKYNF
ncbi:MAG: TonB-dependent receptor [Bacteroidetes bacterium]|nr:TonB-dependent receptor [Bacteroidota bacterium]